MTARTLVDRRSQEGPAWQVRRERPDVAGEEDGAASMRSSRPASRHGATAQPWALVIHSTDASRAPARGQAGRAGASPRRRRRARRAAARRRRARPRSRARAARAGRRRPRAARRCRRRARRRARRGRPRRSAACRRACPARTSGGACTRRGRPRARQCRVQVAARAGSRLRSARGSRRGEHDPAAGAVAVLARTAEQLAADPARLLVRAHDEQRKPPHALAYERQRRSRRPHRRARRPRRRRGRWPAAGATRTRPAAIGAGAARAARRSGG